ncbi:MAG: hypothetical protein J6W75_00810 [Bacteroidaceae bacterium]|nr:hypothetical protein [Bacteroidaceae bacterium]
MKQTIKYSTTMRKNKMVPEDPAKAYASLQFNPTVNLDTLAEHMRQHGTTFSKGTIVGVITDMSGCIRESLCEGSKVEIGDLGTFYPSIIQQGATDLGSFNADNITKLKANFLLGSALQNLKKDATFEKTTKRKSQEAALNAEIAGKDVAEELTDEEENPDNGD